MAHASPVGPAPIASTSQRISGRGLVLGCGRVSATYSVVRKSGINHHVYARDTEASRAQLETEILACGIAATRGENTQRTSDDLLPPGSAWSASLPQSGSMIFAMIQGSLHRSRTFGSTTCQPPSNRRLARALK